MPKCFDSFNNASQWGLPIHFLTGLLKYDMIHSNIDLSLSLSYLLPFQTIKRIQNFKGVLQFKEDQIRLFLLKQICELKQTLSQCSKSKQMAS